MAFLIALINIVAWALIPLTVRKSPASQIAGMGIGTSATALIIYLFTRPAFDLVIWTVALCAGALWTIGQMGQFISFKRIGVSGTIPLSAGFQLVGNSLIGVLVGTTIYVLATHSGRVYRQRATWHNALAGIEFSIGTLFYLFSVKHNGVTDAFIYSQLSSILSTFGGILFLHEHKTHREMIYITIGLVLIVGGSIMTGFAK